MPTGDITGWRQVLAQDFTTDAAVGGFASAYPGWAGYDGNTSGYSGDTWDSSTTMSVSGGILKFRCWTKNGTPQVGALTPLVPGTGAWYQQSQLYGKYSVRFKCDALPGYKIAWLLWPSSNNWNQGEVDFPEANLDGNLTYNSHNVTGNPEDGIYKDLGVRAADGNWHIATTTWESGKVTFELDNTVVGTVTNSGYVPTNPMRWDLQVESRPDSRPSASTDGAIYVDWLVQYAKA